MRYDLLRYDSGAQEIVIKERSVSIDVALNGEIIVSKLQSRAVSIDVQLQKEIYLYAAFLRSSSISAALQSECDLYFNHYRSSEIDVELLDSINLIKKMVRGVNIDSALQVDFTLSKIYDRNYDISGNLLCSVNVRYNHHRSYFVVTLLNSIVSVKSFKTFTMVCGLTIPNGSTLVIDTGNYTAELDGVDVSEYITGDWIMLLRDSIVTIDSGSGGDMNGNISFVERYL